MSTSIILVGEQDDRRKQRASTVSIAHDFAALVDSIQLNHTRYIIPNKVLPSKNSLAAVLGKPLIRHSTPEAHILAPPTSDSTYLHQSITAPKHRCSTPHRATLTIRMPYDQQHAVAARNPSSVLVLRCCTSLSQLGRDRSLHRSRWKGVSGRSGRY